MNETVGWGIGLTALFVVVFLILTGSILPVVGMIILGWLAYLVLSKWMEPGTAKIGGVLCGAFPPFGILILVVAAITWIYKECKLG